MTEDTEKGLYVPLGSDAYILFTPKLGVWIQAAVGLSVLNCLNGAGCLLFLGVGAVVYIPLAVLLIIINPALFFSFLAMHQSHLEEEMPLAPLRKFNYLGMATNEFEWLPPRCVARRLWLRHVGWSLLVFAVSSVGALTPGIWLVSLFMLVAATVVGSVVICLQSLRLHRNIKPGRSLSPEDLKQIVHTMGGPNLNNPAAEGPLRSGPDESSPASLPLSLSMPRPEPSPSLPLPAPLRDADSGAVTPTSAEVTPLCSPVQNKGRLIRHRAPNGGLESTTPEEPRKKPVQRSPVLSIARLFTGSEF